MSNRCAFISGHGDVTYDEFKEHYIPQIESVSEDGVEEFVVGDFKGADLMAQEYLHYLSEMIPTKVTIYHMFEKPRHNPHNFPTVGGFADDESRDAAMTAASTVDIGWIRPGKKNSGTEKNLKRRKS